VHCRQFRHLNSGTRRRLLNEKAPVRFVHSLEIFHIGQKHACFNYAVEIASSGFKDGGYV
jgi:hypothetical protein